MTPFIHILSGICFVSAPSHLQWPCASAAGWSPPSGPWLLWWQSRRQASHDMAVLPTQNPAESNEIKSLENNFFTSNVLNFSSGAVNSSCNSLELFFLSPYNHQSLSCKEVCRDDLVLLDTGHNLLQVWPVSWTVHFSYSLIVVNLPQQRFLEFVRQLLQFSCHSNSSFKATSAMFSCFSISTQAWLISSGLWTSGGTISET